MAAMAYDASSSSASIAPFAAIMAETPQMEEPIASPDFSQGLIQQPTGVRGADLDHREAEIASARHTDIAWFVDAVGLSKNEWPGRPQTDSAAQLLERLAEEVL